MILKAQDVKTCARDKHSSKAFMFVMNKWHKG